MITRTDRVRSHTRYTVKYDSSEAIINTNSNAKSDSILDQIYYSAVQVLSWFTVVGLKPETRTRFVASGLSNDNVGWRLRNPENQPEPACLFFTHVVPIVRLFAINSQLTGKLSYFLRRKASIHSRSCLYIFD